ncbi:MAG: uracil-DNA glycosylase [Pseudomonadota bacterium]
MKGSHRDGSPDPQKDLQALLSWYRLMGVTETIQDCPPGPRKSESHAPNTPPQPTSNTPAQLTSPPPPRPSSSSLVSSPTVPKAKNPPPPNQAQAIQTATAMALAAKGLPELHEALKAFDDCPLKITAQNCVFSDGVAGAELMVIGEAPGAEEDKQGKPFVGRSGRLLDQMLRAIGRDRLAADPAQGVYIANMIPWRPPGNRDPDPHEIAMCMPFIRRHIVLARPKVILLAGRVAAQSLLEVTLAVGAMRGKSWNLPLTDEPHAETAQTVPAQTVPTIVTYHPAFLLRQPHQKRRAWQDLRATQQQLRAATP